MSRHMRHRGPRTLWRRASTGRRVVMVATGAVAVICAMALVMGTIRFIQWRHAVATAQSNQTRLSSEYGFNPGNILSDGQLFTGNAMSRAEVQAFLDKQGASCSAKTCLRTVSFDTDRQSGDGLCADYAGAKHESAATIIDKTSKACSISQKVLLTMLQKEQHLVSSTQPTDFQFKAAMGLSCPDDGHCDSRYAGFARQVYGAAKRYRYYQAHESEYAYHAKALNYVRYHPQASCGGSMVYIENTATALLYIYTPYQPNVAALRAGAGEGDSCSSYGNRNFAIIYHSWFGDSQS
ncbi:MAG: hemagglutinin [Bifidobacterium sp.]|jgi:hypothetical protein|nr:hemagglutinin [Bifidobacterium sp.]MCI1865505.1 hemagglutinin [Bifidobacterium sp.]